MKRIFFLNLMFTQLISNDHSVNVQTQTEQCSWFQQIQDLQKKQEDYYKKLMSESRDIIDQKEILIQNLRAEILVLRSRIDELEKKPVKRKLSAL